MEEKVIYHVGPNGLSWPTDKLFEDEANINTVKDSKVYLNIKTLVRNALTAYDDSGNLKKALTTIKDQLDSDIMLFREYMLTNHNSEVVVYDVNYANVRVSGAVKRKIPKTEKQLLFNATFESACKLVTEFVTLPFKELFTNPTQSDGRKAYVLTHYAVDLLAVNRFNNLQLLESFSGAIKSSKQFNSKLTIAKELRELIPLTGTTLCIFGDGELFTGQPKPLRDTVIDIAKKSNWTPLTSNARILFSIERHDKMLYDLIKSMYKD